MPLTHDGWEYSDVDLDALRRSLAIMMASKEDGRREQLAAKLMDQHWIDVADFCSYCAQMDALKLKHWQSPPAWGRSTDGTDDDPECIALLDRLLDAGLSQWEPDPVAALAKVEEKK